MVIDFVKQKVWYGNWYEDFDTVIVPNPLLHVASKIISALFGLQNWIGLDNSQVQDTHSHIQWRMNDFLFGGNYEELDRRESHFFFFFFN